MTIEQKFNELATLAANSASSCSNLYVMLSEINPQLAENYLACSVECLERANQIRRIRDEPLDQ